MRWCGTGATLKTSVSTSERQVSYDAHHYSSSTFQPHPLTRVRASSDVRTACCNNRATAKQPRAASKTLHRTRDLYSAPHTTRLHRTTVQLYIPAVHVWCTQQCSIDVILRDYNDQLFYGSRKLGACDTLRALCCQPPQHAPFRRLL